MPTTYFLYARKSTEDEGQQIMSIDAQLAELAEHTNRTGITIAEQFIESKSAKRPGRKVFNAMIQKIYKSKEPVGIVSWHPDRLARNSVDGGQIIYLIDIGKIVSLQFPTFWCEATPQGLFMLQLAFGQSKYFSDNLSENVRRGMRQKLRRGEWLSRAPFGYLNNLKTRTIEPDPQKAVLVVQAFILFATGSYTLYMLAKEMALLGMISRNGQMFSRSHLRDILANPVYIGLIRYEGELYQGSFSALISKDIFEAVQEMFRHRARKK